MTQIRLARCGSVVTLAVLATLVSVTPVGALAEWGPLGAGLSGGAVRYLHVWDGKLVAAGQFSSAGGAPANSIAVWDGTQWAPLADGWDTVRGIDTHNGQLVVAGVRADSLDAEIASWDGTAWTTVIKSEFHDLTSFNGKLYQTEWGVDPFGAFSTWSKIWEYGGANWALVGGSSAGPGNTQSMVGVLTVIDSLLYADFEPWGEVETYDGNTWTSLGTTGVDHGRILLKVAGQLHSVGGSEIWSAVVARWNGVGWQWIYSDLNCGGFDSATEYNGTLVAGLCLDAAWRVLSWDGDNWEPVGGETNAWVNALTTYQGKLIAAGAFTEAGGVSTPLIAQLNDVPTSVAISGFTARHYGDGVELVWEIAADEAFDGFHVYRGEIGGIDERVNSSLLAPDMRSYVDNTAQSATRYSYFLVAVGVASGEVRSPRVEIQLPAVTATLLQNAPNPFNPSTTIRFVVPGNDHVSIDIYGPSGQRVRTLVNATFPPGKQSTTWDGTDDNGRRVASGVYLYRMRIGRVEQSKKMVLLK